ncbi:hypothetical protein PF005_g6381 [Phytophthora fragariae]|uniref:Uncharacterized protein n=1 Tax=Phytophthora fragariae TaxID=53985 RepID=A0A6A3LPB8_9STRA|nr:hypothetical protein PF003_g33185 [Phytophthora fragariae]KAE8943295.1 hypothetical protein PF009_g6982 [Phytophthora fragariae]KAE9020005.1 hypothetical protein PF011_g5596 [Phytophthora fragariae]KAE9124707.1 hypothetical protein PF010_g5905 [Phytophthora fragariae]KAE9124961.1 hypothetical protein PF007_g6527 [Phytophthora fragariae]
MLDTGISCACFAAAASAAGQIQRVRKAGHTAGGRSCRRPTPLFTSKFSAEQRQCATLEGGRLAF